MALIEDIWYGRASAWAKPIEFFLAVGSVPYRWGLGRSQRAKLARRRKLPHPVFSVGNLTVGGVGKTPVVEWLARQALEAGAHPVILTRGYGARLKGPVRVDPRPGRWREFGDEPTLLAQSLPDVPVYIGADRYSSGLLAIEEFPETDLFFLDDGFQHLELEREIDLVLIDAQSGFGNRRLLPAGPLREPVEALDRADAVALVSKARASEGQVPLPPGVQPFRVDLEAVGVRPIGSAVTYNPAELQGPVQLLSGIGSPAGFERTAREAGLRVMGHAIYRDHHPYTEQEIRRELEAARGSGRRIVTTVKDAVRLGPFNSLWTDGESPLIIKLGLKSGDAMRHLENLLEAVHPRRTRD